jgi:sugar lactone lactonase YvrE
MSIPTKIARLVQCAAKFKSELGEAPIWDDRSSRLLWLDVLGSKLFTKNKANQVEEHDLKPYTEHITTVIPVFESEYNDTVILGTTEGFARYDLSTRQFESHPSNPIHKTEFPKDIQARSNDGKADPLGRLWLGSLVRNLKTLDIVDQAGGVYVLDGWSSEPVQVMSNISISNGIAWHENKMYYTDSPTAHIDVMNFNVDDSLDVICSTRTPTIKVSEGYPPAPDGCIVDKEGFIWSALFGAGCVRRYDPSTGEAVAEIKLPEEAGAQATACAWGGEHFGDLYITCAHEYWTEEECEEKPLAGCLFVCSAADIAEVCNTDESVGCSSYKFKMKC